MAATIRQKITLEGGDQVKAALTDLGKAGESSFGKIAAAGEKFDFSALNDSINRLADVLDAVGKRMEQVGDGLNKIPVEGLNQKLNDTAVAGDKIAATGAKVVGSYAAVKFAADEAKGATDLIGDSLGLAFNLAGKVIGTLVNFGVAKAAISETNEKIGETNKLLQAQAAITPDAKAKLAEFVAEEEKLGTPVLLAALNALTAATTAVGSAAANAAANGVKKLSDVIGLTQSVIAKIDFAKGLVALPGQLKEATTAFREGLPAAIKDGIVTATSVAATELGRFGSFVGEAATNAGQKFVTFAETATTALATIGTAGLAMAQTFAKSGADATENIAEQAAKLDLTAEAYQRFIAATGRVGISEQDAAKGLSTFAEKVVKAREALNTAKSTWDEFGDLVTRQVFGVAELGPAVQKAIGSFKDLGAQVLDVNGNLKSQGELLRIASDTLQRAAEPGRTNLAKNLGLEGLLPFLKDGVAGMERLREEGDKLNRAFSPEQQQIGTAFKESEREVTSALADIKKAYQNTIAQLSFIIAPNLTTANNIFAEIIKAATDALDRRRPEIIAKATEIKEAIEGAFTARFGTQEEIFDAFATGVIKALIAIAGAVDNYLIPALLLIDKGFEAVAAWLNKTFGTTVSATFLEIAVAAGVLTAAFGSQLPVIGPVVTAFGALLSALLPLAPILIPLGALVVAFWSNFATAGNAAFEGVSKGATAFQNAIKQALAGDFAGAWTSFKLAGAQAFEGLKEAWPVIWKEMKTVAASAWAAIVAAAPAIWKTIKDVAIAIWPDIRAAAEAIFPDLVLAARTIFDGIQQAALAVWAEIKERFPFTAAFFETALAAWQFFFGSLLPGVNNFGDSLGPITRALNALFGTDLKPTEVGTIITLGQMSGLLRGDLTDSIGRANTALRALFFINDLFDGFKAVLETTKQEFLNFIAVIAAGLKTLASPKEALQTGVTEFFNRQLDQAKGNLGLNDTFVDRFKDTAGMVQTLSERLGKVKTVTDQLAQTAPIPDKTGPMRKGVEGAIQDIQKLNRAVQEEEKEEEKASSSPFIDLGTISAGRLKELKAGGKGGSLKGATELGTITPAQLEELKRSFEQAKKAKQELQEEEAIPLPPRRPLEIDALNREGEAANNTKEALQDLNKEASAQPVAALFGGISDKIKALVPGSDTAADSLAEIGKEVDKLQTQLQTLSKSGVAVPNIAGIESSTKTLRSAVEALRKEEEDEEGEEENVVKRHSELQEALRKTTEAFKPAIEKSKQFKDGLDLTNVEPSGGDTRPTLEEARARLGPNAKIIDVKKDMEALAALRGEAEKPITIPPAEGAGKLFEPAIDQGERFKEVVRADKDGFIEFGKAAQETAKTANEVTDFTRDELKQIFDLINASKPALELGSKPLIDPAPTKSAADDISNELSGIVQGVDKLRTDLNAPLPAPDTSGAKTAFQSLKDDEKALTDTQITLPAPDTSAWGGVIAEAQRIAAEVVSVFSQAKVLFAAPDASAWQGVTSEAQRIAGEVVAAFRDGTRATLDAPDTSAWQGIAGEAQRIAGEVVAAFEQISGRVSAAFSSLPGAVQSALSGIAGIVNSMVSNVSSQLDALISKIQSVASAAASAGASAPSGGGDISGGSSGGGDISFEGFAGGGHVRGPGSGTSDSILAWLSDGEFVVNAAATRLWLPLLRAINSFNLPSLKFNIPAFASGGLAVGMPAFAGGGITGAPIHLHMPTGEVFELVAPERVASKVIQYATQQAPRALGRPQAWKR